MAGILSKGITLHYGDSSLAVETELTNLMEIPEIGNGAPEKVEVTVLSDNVKKYIAGLGDSGQELAFKFLYDQEQFESLIGLNESKYWKVSMPDGVNATFQGTPSVKYDGVGANVALTYTLTILVESEITFHAHGA